MCGLIRYPTRMSTKKTAAVSASALAVIALASCTKEETPSVPSVPTADVAPAASNAQADVAPTPSGSEVSRTVEFEQPYSIGTNTATLKGRMVLENGIVKSVEIPDAKGPQATFAAGIADEAYGKPVKGLQIETISGASLTSAAFNEFLKTVE